MDEGGLSFTGARWRLKPADEETARRLSAELGVSALTARALCCRGVADAESARRFLEDDLDGLADPFLMQDMDRAVEAVEGALASGHQIRIYGDYDVDGVCATALLVRALRGLGGRVDWYVPHRVDEGYGLHEEAVRQAAAEGTRLLITVDCGTSAAGEVELARRLGMAVVVTDHHRPDERLPACPVLNPWRPGCGYPYKELAGVGVAFRLVSALARARGLPEGAEGCFLDLVCLGTIADVAPLLGENRIVVRQGLRQLAQSRKVGLRALLEAAGIGGVVGSRQVAFGLAPRINAAGRMEHAQAAVRLLLTEDEEEARALAGELSAQNARRQEEEQQTLAEAEEMVAGEVDLSREKVIVLASERWHPGVIGVVASRLVERYHRPALLIALGEGGGKGSGRSISALNLWEALRECAGVLTRFGGHHFAAGFGVMRDQVGALRRRINEVAEGRLGAEDLVRQVEVDAEASLAELSTEGVSELSRLAPFGMGNPSPMVLTRGVAVASASAVGAGRHLSLRLREEGAQGTEVGAIWFGKGELSEQVAAAGRVEVCHRPRLDEWGGMVSVRLHVEDMRASEKG